MPNGPSAFALLADSRRRLALAIALGLGVLALVVGLTTLQVRQNIRQQLAARDGEVLHAVTLMLYAEEVKEGLAGPITDPANQLSLILRSSELRGVLGVRLLDPSGRFVASFPRTVAPASLAPEHLRQLAALRPACEFHPQLSAASVFRPESSEPAPAPLHVLEVNVPLSLPEGPLAGIAQFLLEGQSLASEFARLDRHLFVQAAIAWLAGALLLGATLGWAFWRLRRAHQLVAERTQNLLRANQELALAAKTSALGAVTAHLLHGLKNPLAGLQQYVRSRATPPASDPDPDWQEAIASTSRMKAMIDHVAAVLREQATEASYEITLPELAEILASRLQPLAGQRSVKLRTLVQAEGSLTNRVANLVALILFNLLENAIEATPPGQTVTLAMRRVASGLKFEVADQGRGLAPGAPLFMPCASTKEGGTGIGLALSKQLSNHLGAELALVGTGPEGSVFGLQLPLPVEQPESVSLQT